MKRLALTEAALHTFCECHHIRKLSLFGSTPKGTAREDSDTDLLVEFKPDARPTFLTLVAMEKELSRLLGGRRVELRTPAELSHYFRQEVLREAEVQYVVR